MGLMYHAITETCNNYIMQLMKMHSTNLG